VTSEMFCYECGVSSGEVEEADVVSVWICPVCIWMRELDATAQQLRLPFPDDTPGQTRRRNGHGATAIRQPLCGVMAR
jgi:hypothetical protein